MRYLILVHTLMLMAGLASGDEPALAIVGATVIDGSGRPAMPDAVVILEGGRIAWAGPGRDAVIPADAVKLDAQGRFLIPGLADMHHHLTPGYAAPDGADTVANLSRLLRWGVTTVFAPHSPTLEQFRVLKRVSLPDQAPMPRFFGSGPMVTTPGGHFSSRSAGGMVADSPERARLIVRELKAAGVDAVKFAYDDLHAFIPQSLPVMDRPTMAALIDEAHLNGLKAYAHAPVLRHAKEALAAGADGLVHGVLSDPVDEEFLELMRRNRAVYISTQALFVCFNDPEGWLNRLQRFDRRKTIPDGVLAALRAATASSPFRVSDEDLANAFDNLARVHHAGIPVVAGTDSGVIGVVSGLSSPMEIALLVEAGLPPMEALKSATVRAAAMLGREDELGTIEEGKRADLVLLDADPLADIANLARVAGVVRGGVVYGDAGELGFPGALPFSNSGS